MGGWWQFLRRVVIFLLGVAVIIDALAEDRSVVAELVVGMILVGVLPLDDFMQLAMRYSRGDRKDDAVTSQRSSERPGSSS